MMEEFREFSWFVVIALSVLPYSQEDPNLLSWISHSQPVPIAGGVQGFGLPPVGLGKKKTTWCLQSDLKRLESRDSKANHLDFTQCPSRISFVLLSCNLLLRSGANLCRVT